MLITRLEADKKVSRQIRELLAEKKLRKVAAKLRELHPADIAEYLDDFTTIERKALFSILDDDTAVKIIQTMDDDLQFEMAQVLGEERLISILDSLPSDEAVDILSHFSKNKIEHLLDRMEDNEAAEARDLLRYDEESAGGIMSADVLYFSDDMTVEETVDMIRRHRNELENLSYLYVTDENKRLVGVVTVKELVLANSDATLGSLMHSEHLVGVRLDDDQEEVVRMVDKYDLLAVPVVDDEDRLVGIVHVDDIIDVMREEATEDMYRMAGLDEDIETTDNTVLQAFSRVRWLIASIVGGLIAGAIIRSLGPDDVQMSKALASFIPAIMGIGGGVAVQSATMLIRGLATGDIEQRDAPYLFFRELKTAACLGLIIGAILFCAACLSEGALKFSVVVAGTMGIQCLVAACVGLSIPLLLNRIGIDPAIAAGPLTTMTCDITGMLVFFGLANLMIRYITL